ncbi:MAG: protein kinase [Myxococcota bacterium]|nr:protein kinase [Myxococcota bacterium]
MSAAGDCLDCPSADELAAFVAGELGSADGRPLNAHVDSCDECRRVVSALAGEQQGEVAASTRVAIGDRLGRFTLMRRLGEGAMGEVFAAHDPELDREVAIKLLRISSERLRREARAMARLNHPNVVTVYELGTDGERAFCAMELVDGKTLRGWLVTPRTWREVLEVAIAVGRGLGAAHAAGLVHRDVKPENVLIARDGRTLVTDFGLAKLAQDETARAITATGEEAVNAMTATGAIVGTPAYMAPEQLAGKGVDERSDQFSYCVTIYEALFDRRPFVAKNVDELHVAMRAGPPKLADTRSVPVRVVRALERGLALDPAARWPSLDALLAELVPTRRRGWLVAGAGIAIVAAAAAVFIATRPAEPSIADARRAGEQRIAQAWSAAASDRLRVAFIATGAPNAEERATALAKVLDTYRDTWLAQREDAWSATHVRGEQSVELLEKRLDCLDRLADSMNALVTLFAQPIATEIKRAPELANRLEPAATCKNLHRLIAKSLAPTSKAGQEAGVMLRELEALQLFGRHAEALRRAEVLVEQTSTLDDPMLHARARYNLGVAQSNAGKYEQAAATLRLAIQDSAAIRDHYMVASAWLRLVSLVGLELGKPDAAQELEPAARAAVAQAGDDARQVAELAFTLGLVAYGRGDLAKARDHMREARARRIALHGAEHPIVASTESNLGAMLMGTGELDEATVVLDHARAATLKSLGDKHPLLAQIELNRSSVAARREDWPSSEASLRVALGINLAVRGPAHPETIKVRTLISRALREQGSYAEARAELERASTSLAESPPTMPAKIELDVSFARLGLAEKKWRDAETHARKAVDAYAAIDVSVEARAAALSVFAEAVAARDAGEALVLYDRALALASTQASRDRHADREVLAKLAEIALAAKRPAVALAWFDKWPDAAAGLGEVRAQLERPNSKR